MLKKILYSCVLAIILPVTCFGQYSNQWINFNQTYFKVSVAKSGIYRITYTDLQTANVPVATIDPRFLQLYHRGVEQSILVKGESDAKLDPTDYIEFYGQKNDGTLDAQLYMPSTLQPHGLYNLFTDTTAYFLTWRVPVPPGGVRMDSSVNTNVTGIPAELSQQHQELQLFTSEYGPGNTTSGGEIQNSWFDEGEGWTDSWICTQSSGCTGFKDYNITNLNRGVTSAGNPQLELLLVGRDELNHQTQVWVGPTAGSLRLLGTQSFTNFQTQKVNFDLDWADIGPSGNLVVEVKALGMFGLRDRVSVSYIRTTIPRDFNLTSLNTQWLTLNPNPSGQSYLAMTNPANGLRLWDITNPDQPAAIRTTLSSGVLNALVPSSSTSRTLLVTNELLKPVIKAVSFQNFLPNQSNYLIVTHASLLNGASQYAAYRASAAGGSFATLTVTVDQLYNQFNYGETSPLGIYQFMKFMTEQGSPRYLFLIGKGRDVSAGYVRSPAGAPDLVPSAGLPASDINFTAQLKGSGYAPAVPTGRLSATTNAQVIAYLNKIKEVESSNLSASAWRKKGLHLSGGIQLAPVNELIQFRSFLDGYKVIAEGEYWGGQVKTIAKHDATAVEQINVSDEVNKGVNLVTFFGHSSPGTIDIDIGKVTDATLGYNNPGKYPVFLINGCNAGNFFANGVSFGEDWMLASARGARGFIAHSSFGFVDNLNRYSDLFYRIALADSTFIKKGLGDVQKEVARQYLQTYGSGMPDVTQVQQMVLLGDPAVKLFGTATPDYQTDDASISLHSVDGQPVTALSPAFDVRFIVRNFGAARGGSLSVRLTRTFNDNSTAVYDSVFNAPLFQDTLSFHLSKGRQAGYGNNRFAIELDYLHLITELDETNNKGVLTRSIPLGSTKNLVPSPYAIVSQQAVKLVFQCTDILSDTRNFQVEIDTVSTFNSGYLQHTLVSGKVLALATINLLAKDSLVYYWRTKLDQPAATESPDWAISSFTYIHNGPEGWIQKQFGQLGENTFTGIVADPVTRRLQFVETTTNVHIKTFGGTNAGSPASVSVKIDNTEFNLATQGQPCGNNTINIIAFDKTSLVPYAGLPFSFQDPRTCGREPQVINSFTSAQTETGAGDDFAAMIDAIHTSDSVVIFSIGTVNYSGWSASLKSKLHQLGILESQLSALQNGDPLIVFGRKGAPAGTATVHVASGAPASAQPLEIQQNVTGRYTSGKMASVLVGPAIQWNQLITQATSLQASDQFHFMVYGLAFTGAEQLLQDNVTAGTLDLSSIDPVQWPLLRLEVFSQDTVNLDPLQLGKWMVTYQSVPEGVLLFNGPKGRSTVAEGQPWSSPYAFVNISGKAFSDSLTVYQQVINSQTLVKDFSSFKIQAPLPGDTTRFSISTDTHHKAGLHDIDVYVNPKVLPEQFYDNNAADFESYLRITADSVAPVLDVTIDGRHLTHGEFVSPNPKIVIEVRDENSFLLKTDTTGISVVLVYPCANPPCDGTPVYLTRSDVRWYPATPDSPFHVSFNPVNLLDGEYTLVVQSTDASGNKSGKDPYMVTFEVKNEATFRFESVYPNPSSSAFFFNFIVSGEVAPDLFNLEVYNSDGRPIRHFGPEEVSQFFVGTNQLVWEPADGAGNRLASGLYLYRLNIRVNGKLHTESGKLMLR